MDTNLTVHYSAGDTGRACGTYGGMRTRDRSEVTCQACRPIMDQDRERIITVDIRCDDCPDGGRCATCTAIMDAAVADTLDNGTDPRHVNVAATAAEQRIALARKIGAEIIADPEGHECLHPEAVAEFLLIAAASRNRALGLVKDTPEAAAQRETERRARVQAVIDQMGA